jgi:sugar lactone lactonase YvrE
MAMSEDGSLLFVTSGANNEIAAYDTGAINALPLNTALAHLPVAAKITLNRPMGLAIRPSAQ